MSRGPSQFKSPEGTEGDVHIEKQSMQRSLRACAVVRPLRNFSSTYRNGGKLGKVRSRPIKLFKDPPPHEAPSQQRRI